jgi:hypothetical protein
MYKALAMAKTPHTRAVGFVVKKNNTERINAHNGLVAPVLGDPGLYSNGIPSASVFAYWRWIHASSNANPA